MNTFYRYEKYFFLLLIFLHLIPVLQLQYFVTHDGPSHVYNSHIIPWLWGGDELMSRFFFLNPNPEPNWLGHLLLIFFSLVFDGNISERILIALYISGLPISFRYLALAVSKNAAWVSYLIFPFIYSLLFYLGFYNFCLGMSLLFFSIAFLIRNGTELKAGKMFLLGGLSLLMYFSHIFIFLMFLPTAYAYAGTQAFFEPGDRKFSLLFRTFIRKSIRITLALLPCFILSVIFVLTHPEEDDIFRQATFLQQLEYIFTCRPLITLDYDEQKYYTIVFASIFWFMFFFTIIQRWKNRRLMPGDWLLMTSLFTMTAYFLIPDAVASGSFVSHRLMLFIYFFAMLWIGSNEINLAIKSFAAPVFALLSIFTLVYHYNESKELNAEAKEMASVEDSIGEGSVVLPINYSYNWLHHNLSNYIPGEKKIVILDNYEAAKPHFPTKWKQNMNPYTIMDFSSLFQSCMAVERYQQVTGEKIDYIIRWGFNNTFSDSCAIAISNYLEKNYTHVITSENNKVELFKRKPIVN